MGYSFILAARNLYMHYFTHRTAHTHWMDHEIFNGTNMKDQSRHSSHHEDTHYHRRKEKLFNTTQHFVYGYPVITEICYRHMFLISSNRSLICIIPDMTAQTTAFLTPVAEHWHEQEIGILMDALPLSQSFTSPRRKLKCEV